MFLTSDVKEASYYGQYVIPFELKDYSSIVFKVESNNPSNEFDDDYSGFGKIGMWSKFSDSGKAVLEIRAALKSTFVTGTDNLIPRTDLAIEFYQ